MEFRYGDKVEITEEPFFNGKQGVVVQHRPAPGGPGKNKKDQFCVDFGLREQWFPEDVLFKVEEGKSA